MTDRAGEETQSWRQHEFRAMNTDVYVWLYAAGGLVMDHVERLFRRYEDALSRFLPESDLSQLNRCPAPSCQVSRVLFDALEAALWAAQISDGIYNPAILPMLEEAGYDRSFERVETQQTKRRKGGLSEEEGTALSATMMTGSHLFDLDAVTLDRGSQTVTRPPGMRFDLGGIGKGWAVDRTADLLHSLGTQTGPFFINAGGDLYAYGRPEAHRGWEAEIVHPLNEEQTLARLYLTNRALATSSVMKRRWLKEGTPQHHLIDPRTGRPAETDLLSVSVHADRTVAAEIYAKTALILGLREGLAFLQALPHVEGLLVTRDARVFCTSGFTGFTKMGALNHCANMVENV